MRAHLTRLVVPGLVAGLAAGCSSGPFDDDARDATIGEVFEANGRAEGYAVDLNLPVDRFRFTVSEPKDVASESLPLANEDVSAKAPEGRAFIAVSYELQLTPGEAHVLNGTNVPEPEVRLVVDGRDYDLDREKARSWILVVPERPDEVRVVAEFDGREFAVDPYDEVGDPNAGDAYGGGVPRRTDLEPQVDTRTKVHDQVEFIGGETFGRHLSPVPWVGHTGPDGWAPAGKKYLLVSVAIERYAYFGSRGDSEWNQDEMVIAEPVFTLDGKEPEAVLDNDFSPVTTDEEDDRRWAVFLVDDDTNSAQLKVARKFTATGEPGPERVAHTVTYERQISLR